MVIREIFLSVLMAASMALAQARAGGVGDGGGNVVRLDIEAVMQWLDENCSSINSLKGVDCGLLLKQMQTAPKFELADKVSLGGDDNRDGKNNSVTKLITYSTSRWLLARADTPRKIGIVLHENLGAMSIEGTDDFHITKLVVNELRARSIQLKSPVPITTKSECRFDYRGLRGEGTSVEMSYAIYNRSGDFIGHVEGQDLNSVSDEIQLLNNSLFCHQSQSKCVLEYASGIDGVRSFWIRDESRSRIITPFESSSNLDIINQYQALSDSGVCEKRADSCWVKFNDGQGDGKVVQFSYSIFAANDKLIGPIIATSAMDFLGQFTQLKATGICRP